MECDEIRQHWTNWAVEHGTNLEATTRAATAKRLELDALVRNMRPILSEKPSARILEIGCGNGVNCVHLAKEFVSAKFWGVDFVPEMVDAAKSKADMENVSDRVEFYVGNILNLDQIAAITGIYDCVFTDRCIINLNSTALQRAAVSALAERVAPGGRLIHIENSNTSFALQNACRERLGLRPRVPASFNLFINDNDLIEEIEKSGLQMISIEDFSSLHDLLLYVLIPSLNGGTIEYDHPLVEAAARLSIQTSEVSVSAFGPFGQNRLFVAERRSFR